MTRVAVSNGALKARMLQYFHQVEEIGVPLVVNDHGKPVLQVALFAERRPMAEALAEFRASGAFRFAGDPNAGTVNEWDDA